MKTMTCKQLGGACDFEHHGEDYNEVIKAQDQHLKAAVAGGRHPARAGSEGHEGPVAAPRVRHEVVQAGPARLRRAPQ